MPPPKFKVRVEKSVMVPMRDGIRLSTDLYFPEGVGVKLPVILIRTPYNKQVRWLQPAINFFAGQGYVVAVQDVRGKFESQGDYVISAADPQDGYDTDDWLSAQSWSSGKIGTYGCSYLGDVQVMQARLRNPKLAAMIPQAAGSSITYRYFGLWNGGALELAAGLGWFRDFGSKVYIHFPDSTSHEAFLASKKYFDIAPKLPPINYQEAWRALPLIGAVRRLGGPPTDWEAVVSHAPGDPWWDQFGYVKPDDHFDTPSLQVNSWYDFGIGETLYQFNLFRTNAVDTRGRDNQFIVISPTPHCASESATEHTVVGSRDLGDAQFDYWQLYLHWFDYWLKGISNGVTSMPKLQIYVMGRGQWRSENEWPLARTKFTNYYLHSDGHANSRFGTGTLTTNAPSDEVSDQYFYDPGTPVPSVGGPVCCTGTTEAPAGSFDQSGVEIRNDVLVYTTPVLSKGIEVTGPIKAVLYVSSSAKDTDFTGKLVDVYPDGTAYNVQEGILRARYREGFEKTVWIKPNTVYPVIICLEATSNYFPPGHRIRLEVSSSNFPRFDRNLNTGGKNYDESTWEVAHNFIHHSKRYPSRIVLPVIP
ncbi:MAG TPA: CocE/NonD family hydrolase [Terriglobales bacterium]|nr:CocE/NonD family hydrolase [Terriglobales bacterium]